MLDSLRVLTLVLSCSSHPDEGLVRAVVALQSDGNPLFIGDLSDLTRPTLDHLPNVDAAVEALEQVRRRGGRPAVGLLGIPADWAAAYGLSERQLFDG